MSDDTDFETASDYQADQAFLRALNTQIKARTERDISEPAPEFVVTERPVTLRLLELPPDGPENPPKLRGEAARLAAQEARERRRDYAEGLRLRLTECPRPAFGCFEIADLQETDCRFPVTEQAPHRFCGRRALRIYCAEHLAICNRGYYAEAI